MMGGGILASSAALMVAGAFMIGNGSDACAQGAKSQAPMETMEDAAAQQNCIVPV